MFLPNYVDTAVVIRFLLQCKRAATAFTLQTQYTPNNWDTLVQVACPIKRIRLWRHDVIVLTMLTKLN